MKAGGSCPGRSWRVSPPYITLPEGGVGLGRGVRQRSADHRLCQKEPQGRMVGIDRWGVEYASYSRKLCERNAGQRG